MGYTDYYPFGSIMPERSQNDASVDGRYKFTAKERDAETGWDYFGARYYDSFIGRWLQVDPLAEKYPEWNPYNYTMNNPPNIFDPNGMDTLYFDAQGNYLADQTKKGEGDHVGYYTDKDGNLVNFSFNDQSDAESIIKGVENIDHFRLSGINIGENKVGQILVGINSLFGMIPGYVFNQSQQIGMMDYVHQITKLDKSINDRVTVIDGIGYNNFDLGNYYWGETMGNLGYTPVMAKLAAQMFERLFHNRVDDPTDQRAIENGARKK